MIRRLAILAVLALGPGALAAADVQYGIEVENADLIYMMGKHAAGADLEMGRGGAVDLAGAARAYRTAALLGYPLAQNRLGWLYESGRGVPQDYAMAYAWYAVAASRGDENAVANRDAMAGRLGRNGVLDAQVLARQMNRQLR